MGGVNSQVRLSEAEMEAAVRDLRALLGPLQVAALCVLAQRLRLVSEVLVMDFPSFLPESADFGRDERKRFLLGRVSMATRPRHTCAVVNKSWNLGLSTALDLSRLIFSPRRG